MITKINHKLNNKYLNLRLRSAVLDQVSKAVSYTFSYPASLSIEEKEEITLAVQELTPDDNSVSTDFISDFINKQILSEIISKYFIRNHPHLAALINSERINIEFLNKTYNVELIIDKQLDEMIIQQKIIQQLNEYLVNYTSRKIVIKKKIIDINLTKTREDLKVRQNNLINRILSTPVRKIEITGVVPLVGKQIFSTPNYILDLIEPVPSCVICGKVSNINLKSTDKWNIFKMDLTDLSGSITVVYFYKIDVKSAVSQIKENDELVVFGKAEINNYSHNIEVKAFNISRCNILDTNKNLKFINTPKDNWQVISPVDIVNPVQQNYLDADAGVNEFFQSNTFVAFSLAVTGNNVLTSDVTQFSAVKIVNGQLSQLLSSNVYPKSDDSTKLTFSDIMADIYKFCYDCIMISFNIDADINFLQYYAKFCNYHFDNKLIDVSKQAIKHFNSSSEKPLANVTLSSVNERIFGQMANYTTTTEVALATAKLYIKLIELISEIH